MLGLRRKFSDESWTGWFLGHVLWVLGGRELCFWWQRCTRGFDDSELWSLDLTMCIYRTNARERNRVRSSWGKAIQSKYGFLADLLKEGDAGKETYSHSIEEFFSRLEELARNSTRKQALLIRSLQDPATFLEVLAKMVRAHLIEVSIARFGKDRVLPGKLETVWDSHKGQRKD